MLVIATATATRIAGKFPRARNQGGNPDVSAFGASPGTKGVNVMKMRVHGKQAVPRAAAAAATTAAVVTVATVTAIAAAGGMAGTASAAVVRASSASAAAPAWTAPKRTLREGDTGAAVRALQERLNSLHYYPGPHDGKFGNDTLEAVWAFQEVQRIPVDGIVGPQTWKALEHPKSPTPHNPGVATRIEVNLKMRVLVLYRDHSIRLISHISAGGGYYFCNPGGGCAYAVTPAGTYHTTVFMPGWVTVPLGEMYNPVFFIGTAYAIHGDTDVPVNPVSHGCVRIPMDIAAFFHNRVRTPGTEVIVYN